MIKSKLDLHLTIGILILLITVGSAAFLLGKYSSFPREENKTEIIISPSPSPITLIDPTTDWITYKGKTYEYKLPPNWIAIDDQLLSYNPDEIPDEERGLPVPPSKLKVDFVKLPADFSIPEENVSEVESRRIGGKPALSQVECDELGCSRAFYIYLSDRVLALFVYPANSQALSTFNQILETFKFAPSEDDSPSEGPAFCGGIAGKICPTGYTCQYEGDFPDAGGICMKEK